MSEVLDIIHKLSYDVNSTSLDKALKSIEAQVSTIEKLQAAEQKLVAQRAASTDPAKQATYQKAIDNTRSAIDRQTQSLTANIQQNKALNDAIQKEIGLVGQLQTKLKQLKNDQTGAANPAAAKNIASQIKATQSQLNGLLGKGEDKGILSSLLGVQSGTGIGGQILKGVIGGFGIGSGIGIITALTNGLVKLFQTTAAGKDLDNYFTKLGDNILGTTNYADGLKKEIASTRAEVEKLVEEFAKITINLPNVTGNAADLANKAALAKGGGIFNGESFAFEQKVFDAEQKAREKELEDNKELVKVYDQLIQKRNESRFTADNLQRRNGQQPLLLPDDRTLTPYGVASFNKLNKDVADKIAKLAKDESISITKATARVLEDLRFQRDTILQEGGKKTTEIEAANLQNIAKLREAQYTLLLSLNRANLDAETKLAEQRIANEENLTHKTEENIKERARLETEESNRHIEQEKEDARKRGALSGEVSATLDQKAADAREAIRLKEQDEILNFRRQRLIAEETFNENLRKIDLEGQNAILKLLQDAEAPTLQTRQNIADQQTEIALAANSKEYDAAIESARLIGESTEDIDREYQTREKLIILQGQRAQIQALDDYFKERLSLINKDNQQEVNSIQVLAGEIIDKYADLYEGDQVGYRKYRKEKARAQYDADRDALQQQRLSDQKALKEAKDFQARILANPNSNEADRKNAQDQVNQARNRATASNGRFLSTAPQGSRGFENIFGDTARIADPEERRQKAIKQSIDAYQSLAEAAVAAFNTIYNAQIASLNAEIEIRNRRVTEATKLS